MSDSQDTERVDGGQPTSTDTTDTTLEDLRAQLAAKEALITKLRKTEDEYKTVKRDYLGPELDSLKAKLGDIAEDFAGLPAARQLGAMRKVAAAIDKASATADAAAAKGDDALVEAATAKAAAQTGQGRPAQPSADVANATPEGGVKNVFDIDALMKSLADPKTGHVDSAQLKQLRERLPKV